MNLEVLSIIVFFIGIAIVAYFDRKKIEFKKGVLYRRTKRGKNKIKQIAVKHKKFFKWFGNASVIIAFIVSIGGLFLLLQMTNMMIQKPEIGPSAKLILPKVPVEGVCTHALCVPFWFWIIAIFVIITPHELMHGFLMATEKIRIKSLGLILFLIFPGAFVEPDEKQFQKSKPITRMRVASVGSIANIIVFLVLSGILLFYNFAASQIYETKGVQFEGVIDNTPAQEVGLKGTITEMNSYKINDYYDFASVLSNLTAGDKVNIVTTEGVFSFNAGSHPENETVAFIGISNISTSVEYNQKLSFLGQPNYSLTIYDWINKLFGWVILLNINVAIINLLPFLPFDGGVMWYSLFEKYFKKNAKVMILGLTFFTYGIIILNVIGIGRIINLFV